MRSFRAKPVGWRNESYRHYLASKGIRTTEYFALKGFTKEQEERIQKVFDENPRLKFKRDKSVRNIISSDSSVVKEDPYYGFTDIKTGEVPNIVLNRKIVDNEDKLRDTLNHELTHSSEFAKNPKIFEVGTRVNELANGEGLDVHGDWINPAEYHAYSQEDKNLKRNKEYKRIRAISEERRKAPDVVKEKVGFFKGATQKYNEELQKSPNLKELPDVWEK